MRDVADRGEQRRIHHRRADAEHHRARGEASESAGHEHEADPHRLHPHARGDEPLAPDPVGPRSREQLRDAPRRGIDRSEGRDLFDVHVRGREEQGEEAPRHAIVEIVDQARLADAREVSIAQGRAPEDLALVELGCGCSVRVQRRLVGDVMLRLAHDECRQPEPGGDEADAEIERLRPQTVVGGDPSCGERAASHREIAGELVEPHRHAAPLRPREVDLHDDRRRPRQPLADAEQHVGEQDPVPARRPHEQERHGGGGDPARDEHVLAAEAIGEASSEVVRQRLGDAEHDDERQHCGACRELELLLADRGQDAPLHADHRAHERVDDDEQRELAEVLTQSESDRWCHGEASPVSMRHPRARQSVTPCSMRCASKPFLRRSSTASIAITQ
jgi:hypothetical protein